MIRVEAMGGFRVLKDGKELASLPGKPVRAALLAYLAVERESGRENLCSLLWPNSSPERARRSLSQTLYELRKELGDTWLESSGDRVVVTDELSTDVSELRAALSQNRWIGTLDAYSGPFLDGTSLAGGVDFERWAEQIRADLHTELKRAFRSAVTAGSDPATKVRLAQDWVSLDPLDDEAQHALIEGLAESGDRTRALEQYRIYSELIAAELEVEPLDHTVELVEQIKAGTVQAAAPGRRETFRTVETEDTGEDQQSSLRLDPGLVVLRLIGRGATGSVYLAREPALQRLVAVKVLDPELARVPTARARFEREAQSAARIRHPHVAPVYRVGTTADDTPYLVMPFVKGGTLADRMKASGPMPPEEVRRLLAQSASALAAAHAEGVVHRDVRPANFLYDEDTGDSYLSDFGVAGVLESGTDEMIQLTRTGELLGNAEYISPEQALGDDLDGRSDVYSLGILGRALLFGNAPSLADMEACPDRELVKLLDRATSKDARHRPSAAELEAALRGEGETQGSARRGVLDALLGWLRH